MADLNPIVLDVTVIVGASGITTQGFGTPLIAARGLGGGFTERLRRYTSASAANNDADLGAAAQAAVSAAFAQPRSVSQVAVGRVEADAAQVIDFTVTGDSVNDDSYTITINGISFNYTEAGGGTLAANVAAALGAGLAGVLVGEAVTVSWLGAVVTVTADVAGTAFDYSSTFVAGAGSSSGLTETIDTANVSIATELQAIADADPDWYGLTLLSRLAIDIERAAGWVESSTPPRLFFAQSSDPDNLTAAGTSILDTLKTLSYKKTHGAYHFDDDEYPDIALMSAFLSVNPDSATTTANNKTLAGVTPHTPQTGNPNTVTATQLANLLAKNGNIYGILQGAGSTYKGRTSFGILVSTALSADWVKARIEEDIAALLLRKSNSGSRVTMSDPGIGEVASQMTDAVERGYKNVTPPHFIGGTETYAIPLLKDVPPADRAAGAITLGFTIEEAGEIQSVTINGTVVTPL